MRRSTKILFVRRTVFVLLILAVHILQNTRGLFPEIFGVKANLLIPLVICIGMFEREIAGAVLGMLAGILWDSVSPMGDGYQCTFAYACGCGSRSAHRLPYEKQSYDGAAAVGLCVPYILGILCCVFPARKRS